MKKTGGIWRERRGWGGGGGWGGGTVIKMRAEEKAHVRNKQKCVLTMCACVCVCVFVALSYPLCAVCLRGIRGDPCATGIYNRPAGLSLCDDKTLRVLCECLCECVYVRACVSQQAVLYRNTSLWEWGDSH